MAASIVVATWLGLNPPGFAAQTVALAFGIAAATIFPALMMGIFSTRINNKGAVWGMLTGLIFTVVYIFMHKGWFFIPGTNQFEDTISGSLFGIQSTAIGCGRRSAELPGRVLRLRPHGRNAGAHQGAGRKRPHSARRRHGHGPLMSRAGALSGARLLTHAPSARPRAGLFLRGSRAMINADFLATVHPWDTLPPDALQSVAAAFACRGPRGQAQ